MYAVCNIVYYIYMMIKKYTVYMVASYFYVLFLEFMHFYVHSSGPTHLPLLVGH